MPSIRNPDVEIISVQQRHAHQWHSVHRICLDILWLPIPQYCYAIDVKQLLAAVGQQRAATTAAGEPECCDEGRWQREKAVEACVNNGIDFVLVPYGSLETKADDGFIVRIDGSRDHVCSRRGRPPMRWST